MFEECWEKFEQFSSYLRQYKPLDYVIQSPLRGISTLFSIFIPLLCFQKLTAVLVYINPKTQTCRSGWLIQIPSVQFSSVPFSSVAQSCLTLCDPMNRSTPGLPVHHQLPEFTQIHIHWVRDAIQPSHPLSSPSPPAPNTSQHQSLFRWVNSSYEVAKVLEFQL